MERNVLIYDGQCAICQGSVGWVRRLDWRHRFELLDAHDPSVARRFPELAPAALMSAIHLITPEGTILTGYDAVRYQVRFLPLLAWLTPILRLPIMDRWGPRLYGLVARNRYRLNRLLGRPVACEAGTCHVPH